MEDNNQNPVNSEQPQYQNISYGPTITSPLQNNVPTHQQDTAPVFTNQAPTFQATLHNSLKQAGLLARLSLIFGSASLIILLIVKIVGGQFSAQKFTNFFLGLLAVSVLMFLIYLWQVLKDKTTKILIAVFVVLFASSYICIFLERNYTLPIQKDEFYWTEQLKNATRLFTVDAIEGNEVKARDTKRQTDIKAMHSQLEAYFAQNMVGYPAFVDFNSSTWRAENMNGLDELVICDPGADDQTNCSLVNKPQASAYAYETWENDGVTPCNVTSNEVCRKYTLTATLEDKINGSGVYVKNSLN
jgi:hypothetical protein